MKNPSFTEAFKMWKKLSIKDRLQACKLYGDDNSANFWALDAVKGKLSPDGWKLLEKIRGGDK